ncbi:hypothetical protein [Arachnia propionica]|uniref:hypothetical protein n=1 Tax=Arachnia propionica TaxID=1750 RepID=UPI00163965FE|nr:hypothetical protein [Arachnia propionica]
MRYLILLARDVERLTAVADEVQERHRVHVEIVARLVTWLLPRHTLIAVAGRSVVP